MIHLGAVNNEIKLRKSAGRAAEQPERVVDLRFVKLLLGQEAVAKRLMTDIEHQFEVGRSADPHRLSTPGLTLCSTIEAQE